ncbi:MAG: c-type cytochrome domain-containing protein [Imperialibacter sp.]|uniref:c-type cytochrome domain-containing protein n=1 Tax=Imperialibacter sp. TaxID=2038411 RepID=UPI0032EEF1C8
MKISKLRKKGRMIAVVIGLFGGLVVINSCSHEPDDLSSLREICFDTEILPIFTSNCALSGCHNSNGGKEGYIFNSFDKITSKGIQPGDARHSRVYTVLYALGENQMPPSGVLPEEQRTLIRLWIDQGAKETSCVPGEDGTDGSTANGVCFETEVLPLIVSNCAMSGCHDAASHEEGYNFTTYTNIRRAVSAGSPAKSKLYRSMSGSGEDLMPPSPYARLTAIQLDIVKNWILEGANETTCDSCDPAQFAYAANIAPIAGTYCQGCHSGSSPSGSIRLETFSDMEKVAASGQLIGAITGASGYSLMPPAGKLQDCQIEQLSSWVAANTPNN